MGALETPATPDRSRRQPAPAQPEGPGARLGRVAPPAVVVALTIAFIAFSIWYVFADARLQNGDSGKHLLIAFGYHDLIQDGNLRGVFGVYNSYPPLVHIVGAIGSLIAGPSVHTGVITANLVFVPLLALGCYGAGNAAFGSWAGALAAVFAFATPMIDSVFHVFMLDAPTAALVAVTVWGLLESERFARVGVAALAGVAAGAGMYAKSTFPLFLFGLVLAMVLRGGWRNWRGLLTFGGTAILLAAPWYIRHWNAIFGQTKGAVNPQQVNWYGNVPYPHRWSIDNFTWYGWNLINNQLYLPLTLFLVAGLVFFTWRWLVRRRPESFSPELIAGAVGSYIGISLISLDDPRYTLPALVYAAVLGTGWIVHLRRPLALAAAGALAAVLVLNPLLQYAGKPKSNWVIQLPGAIASPIGQRQLRVTSNFGYDASQPDRRGAKPLFDLLERAREAGAKQVVFEAASLNTGGYNLNGVSVVARSAGLDVIGYDPSPYFIRKPTDIVVFRRTPEKKLGRYCLRSFTIDDGTGFYIQWGPAKPKQHLRCP